MKTAEASIYFDRLRPKKDGTCSVKIKITFNRERCYYSTGIDLTPEVFSHVMNNKRRTAEQKELLHKLNYFLNKATDTIQGMKVFTFEAFEELFFEQRNTQDSVSFAFDKYIEQLRLEKRVGTAVSYSCAKNSLEEYKPGLKFANLTPKFLKRYENWMLNNGNSITTVGIYLRSLRTIFNQQNIDRTFYPFGNSKDKYSIPTSRNIKKALTLEEVARIYNYPATPGSTKEMARDYWLFLYLCNGMNVKDFCLLKWENFEGDVLRYYRAKTTRTKKESKQITVSVKPEVREIIRKWGRPSVIPTAYIFPHLNPDNTAEQERAIIQRLTQSINLHMKNIARELDINKDVTTYFARHSFATVLKRAGTPIEMISELLGHSNVGVTESYLDGFESEQIKKATDVLTQGFKKAN